MAMSFAVGLDASDYAADTIEIKKQKLNQNQLFWGHYKKY
jgi:hypothetical protein